MIGVFWVQSAYAFENITYEMGMQWLHQNSEVKIVSKDISYYLNKYQDPKKSTKIINDYVKVAD